MDANEFLDCDFVNIKRESIPCLGNISNLESAGRESFGLLRPNIIGFQSINDNFINIERESIPCIDSELKSRDSLGALSSTFLRTLNVSVEILDDSVFLENDQRKYLNVPEIFIEDSETSSQEALSHLNMAFLHSQCKSTSIMCSSMNSFGSLNSKTSMSSDPSPIYSVSHNSKFNNAFQKISADLDDSFINKFNRLRIQSLPAILEQTHDAEKFHVVENEWKTQHKSEPDFNAFCFVVEAEHIASKIADGSILETDCGDVDLLDSIPEPCWEELLEDEIEESPQLKTENVFKLVDKLIPTAKQAEDIITNNLQTDSVKSNEMQNHSICDFNNRTTASQISSTGTNSLSRNDFLQNLSNVFDLPRMATSQASQSSDKSKSSQDAKVIIQNLSEIFKHENRSNEQQLEGQNLIMCLAEMLCTEKSRSEELSEDSGHSSVETDDIQKCNISKSGPVESSTDKRLSHSLSFQEKKQESLKVDKNLKECKGISNFPETKRSRSMSASSIDKNNFKKLSVGRNSIAGSTVTKPSSLGKFKTRRSEEIANMKRGPMKAVIPVGRMSKVKRPDEITKDITPPKTQVPPKKKCVSTPIEESLLHPVAQSTPGSGGNNTGRLKSPKYSSQAPQRKFDYSISPLSRSNVSKNGSGTKINHSGSEPNLIGSIEINSSKIHRRKSTNDLKNKERPMGLKRSHSIGQDSASSGSVLKAREKANILKVSNTSRIAVHKSRDSLNEKSIPKSNLNIKPFNLMSKLRANGKENAGH